MGELLNHLGISKSFVSAIFVTSVALIGGPFVLPGFFEPLEGLWRTGVIGAGIFSFTQLVAWFLPPIFRAVTSFPSKTLHSMFWNPPNAIESAFLRFLGEKFPNEWVTFDMLRHEEISLIRLIEISRSLQEKKLVLVGLTNDAVLITDKGRKYVLKQIEKKES